MHRLTLAWLFAQKRWGGRFRRGSQSMEVADRSELTGLPFWVTVCHPGKRDVGWRRKEGASLPLGPL